MDDLNKNYTLRVSGAQQNVSLNQCSIGSCGGGGGGGGGGGTGLGGGGSTAVRCELCVREEKECICSPTTCEPLEMTLFAVLRTRLNTLVVLVIGRTARADTLLFSCEAETASFQLPQLTQGCAATADKIARF